MVYDRTIVKPRGLGDATPQGSWFLPDISRGAAGRLAMTYGWWHQTTLRLPCPRPPCAPAFCGGSHAYLSRGTKGSLRALPARSPSPQVHLLIGGRILRDAQSLPQTQPKGEQKESRTARNSVAHPRGDERAQRQRGLHRLVQAPNCPLDPPPTAAPFVGATGSQRRIPRWGPQPDVCVALARQELCSPTWPPGPRSPRGSGRCRTA
jgi:hypothetical protein